MPTTPTNTLDDLAASLPTERAKLNRIESQLRKTEHDARAKNIDCDIIRQELADDAKQAIIDDRQPDGSIEKNLATSERELARLRKSVETCKAALTQQSATVANIEAQIDGKRKESLDRALKQSKVMDRIFASIAKLGDACQELCDTAARHGFPEGAPPDLILPPALYDVREPLANFQARDTLLYLMSLSLTYRAQSAALAAAERAQPPNN